MSAQRPGRDSRVAAATATLAPGIATLTQLRELRLARCALGGAAAAHLFVQCSQLQHLAVLDLEGNPLGAKGLKALTAWMHGLPALERLIVDDCDLEDEAFYPLTNALHVATGAEVEKPFTMQGTRVERVECPSLLASWLYGNVVRCV